MSQSISCRFALCFSTTMTTSLLSCPVDRHVYDNVGMKVKDRHIYENIGELRDATPDLILAVKPKIPLEDEQVTAWDQRTSECLLLNTPALLWHCCFLFFSLFLSCLQFIGAEFGDDKASASDSSRFSSVDRAERNSRALSLHNSITKSECFSVPAGCMFNLMFVRLHIPMVKNS